MYDPESDRYRRGVELFNAGEFFESHEVWEELWLEEPGPAKLFLQGLIQVAAAFHHFQQSNYAGTRSLLKTGMEKLEGFRPRYGGIDLDAFLGRLLDCQRELERQKVAGQPPTVVPPRIELQ
ncbi:MAG: DUF309 domain-containing protein [Acidobacteria bacterium]|nr:DUF309 domain-containing protein [Acidobacteriota bacterium]